MKYVSGCLSGALFCLFVILPKAFSAEVSCECPKLGCDPCSYQQSLKFYTDKCGPDNSKVKSCARPTCSPIDQATAECPVPPKADSGPREPVVLKAVDTPKEDGAEKPTDNSGVGRVKVISGSVSITHADGKKTVVSQNAQLQEGETVESAADGSAVIDFEGGNKVHVHPDTALEVKEYKDPKVEASRKALLNLIKGKIRNQVEQKYNGKTSYYRIQVKGAVAGVRGTDFVVTQFDGDGGETRVETLRGLVVFDQDGAKEHHEVGHGQGITFGKGVVTDFKISDQELRQLDRGSRVDVAKSKLHKDSAICEKPRGLFNQCAWHCRGNPVGEHKCRVDMPNVACVRSRCNGNGSWAEETRLAEPAGTIACPGSGYSVKDCDY